MRRHDEDEETGRRQVALKEKNTHKEKQILVEAPPDLVRCMPACERRLPHVLSPQPESPQRGRE